MIVPREEWDDWLMCRDPEVARSFLVLPSENEMNAEAAQLTQNNSIVKR